MNAQAMRRGIAGLLIVTPWVQPFAPAPSTAVVPLLLSWFCLCLLWLVWPRRDPRLYAVAWVVAAAISVAMGIVQYAGTPPSLAWLITPAGPLDVYANLRQRNQFATLCSIGFAALLWGGRRSLGRLTDVAIAVFLAIGNAMSLSRTGALQLLMIAAFVLLWKSPKKATRLKLCAAAIAAYLLTAAMLPLLTPWFTDAPGSNAFMRMASDSAACSSRFVLWANVAELIQAKPWTGWGAGELDYAHYMHLYSALRFCDILDNAHNLPLHLAVEFGIPAALLVCGGVLVLVARARPWQERNPSRCLAWMVLALIMLHSMVEYPLWYGPFQFAACLCVVVLWRSAPGAPPFRLRQFPGLLVAGAPALLTVLIAQAGWEYWRVRQIYLPLEARASAYRTGTLDKVRDSRFFQRQVAFAEFTLSTLTPANAQWTLDTATELLHFSPEPRVIEALLESALLLHRNDIFQHHLVRYNAAFPLEHAAWRQKWGLN